MSINLNSSEVENPDEAPKFGNRDEDICVSVPSMIMDTEANEIVRESEF